MDPDTVVIHPAHWQTGRLGKDDNARRRKQAFESDPRCAWGFEDGTRCERLGAKLDHIVPLDQGGAEYAASNLQLLCAEHHWPQTAIETRGRAA